MILARVLEPEIMDSPEEANDYNDMDHSAVNVQFVTDLLDFAKERDFEIEDVLDIGTATALIPIELCNRLDTCRVMAIDMAINMLELARYNIEADGMIERIQLGKVDAKAMGYDDGMFDCVMTNSIVHHMADPIICLREAVRVTREGGLLFARDLMRPDTSEQVQALVQTYAGDENTHSQQMFDDSLRASLSLEEIRALVQELGFDPQTVYASSDRHWTWAAIKPESDDR